jgi:hypothetical protein
VTALGPAELAAVAAGPASLRVYLRHCFIPARGTPDPLWVKAGSESRWWSPRGTLYVAEEPQTVMAEHCRNNADSVAAADPTGGVGLNIYNFAAYSDQPVGPPLAARALFSVEVAFDRLADLTSTVAIAALAAIGVDDQELLADDYGPCPAIAQAGEQLGWQAVRARSAALSGGVSLGIFRDAHPELARWRVERDAVRPSVRVAFLTRYRTGERPAWLGV